MKRVASLTRSGWLARTEIGMLVGWLVVMATIVQAGETSIHASLTPSRFRVDEEARLTIAVSGNINRVPDQPHASGLHLAYQRQSNRLEWVNGRKAVQQVSYHYRVTADRPGHYTIGPVRLRLGKQVLQTRPIACEVLAATSGGQTSPVKPSTPTARLRSGVSDQVGFIQVEPETTRSYTGELVPITIKAFFHQGIRANINSFPSITSDNFFVQSLDKQPVRGQETVHGKRYTTFTWHGLLAGVRQGKFTLEVELPATVYIRNQKRQSPFGVPLFEDDFLNDDFFASFFGTYKEKDIKLITPPRVMTIQALPAKGKPADFRGAVGRFSLAVTATPTDGRVGDPITLKMQITGTGNFNTVQEPVLTHTRGWKTYPPSVDFQSLGETRGKKTFTQALVPLHKELAAVPPLSFAFFDPKAGEYVTLKSEPIILHLQTTPATGRVAADPAATAPGPAPVSRRQKRSQPGNTGNQLLPLHLEAGRLLTSYQPVYRRPWFLGMLALAGLMVLGTALLQISSLYRRRHPEKIRSRERMRQLQARLAQLEQQMHQGDEAAAQALGRRIIQEEVGYRFGLEPQAVTSRDLVCHLGPEAPLTLLLQRVEQGAFGPVTWSRSELEHMVRILKEQTGVYP